MSCDRTLDTGLGNAGFTLTSVFPISRQRLDDTAVPNHAATFAAEAEALQLDLQRAQVCQALPHLVEMLYNALIHISARSIHPVGKIEQFANAVDAETEMPAAADEQQSIQIGVVVETVATVVSRRISQQALSFVIPDSHRLGLRSLCQLPNCVFAGGYDSSPVSLDLIVTITFILPRYEPVL